MYNDIHNPKLLECTGICNAPSRLVSRCSNILCIMCAKLKCTTSNEYEINGSYSLVSIPDILTYFTTEELRQTYHDQEVPGLIPSKVKIFFPYYRWML